MHGLVAEKAKLGRFLTSKGGFQHRNYVKMNIRILGDAMAVQRQNDQKVASYTCAKA